jgi:hypothetical protein
MNLATVGQRGGADLNVGGHASLPPALYAVHPDDPVCGRLANLARAQEFVHNLAIMFLGTVDMLLVKPDRAETRDVMASRLSRLPEFRL